MTHSDPLRAEVWRGTICESLHEAFAVEVNASGELKRAWGDPDLIAPLRSAAKPLQAVSLVTHPKFSTLDIRAEELAVCCASHPGQPRHTALVASALSLCGFSPDHLVCGTPPGALSPLAHGCSGNHTALLLTAHLMGAPLEGYADPNHPVQREVMRQIAQMAGEESLLTATDGCGIPTFGMSLTAMARAFAALIRPGAPWEAIPKVMGDYPELIGAEDWIDVRLMQVTRGRVIAKTGAEGLLCLDMAREGRGMAVKILDGSTRALGLATLAALERAGWITPEEAAHPLLAQLRHPRLFASTGEVAAEIRLSA
jgi:L-asparaginase II